MDRETGQNVVFRLGQIDFVFADKDLPFVIVDHQILKPVFAAGCTLIFCSLPMTAENGADTGQQFLCAEGLCNVVVGAQIQSLYLVPFVGAGGQNNNGGRVRFPDLPDQIQPVPVRQTKVQND